MPLDAAAFLALKPRGADRGAHFYFLDSMDFWRDRFDADQQALLHALEFRPCQRALLMQREDVSKLGDASLNGRVAGLGNQWLLAPLLGSGGAWRG